ncbi:MAG: ABC transporter ATP-binding protein [Spirochaetota bacterium]
MLAIDEYGVEINRLAKSFRLLPDWSRSVAALDGVDLRVNPNELFVILGPSGCGKSTLLRCVAGLEVPDEGTIALGGRTVFSSVTGESVAPRDRRIGMVFQNFALYPHMTAAENVAFGMQARRVPQAEARERVEKALAFVEMEELADRTPAHLSGGQQQRIAVARAIAGSPRLLLFDEPLSNLDPLLRTTLRADLKLLIQRLGITTLFVTHDQEEAMILGDRLAVMERGRIRQIGTPAEVYRRPETLFVAAFTGRPATNLIEGIVDEHEGRQVLVPIESRAEMLTIPRELKTFRNQRVTIHVRPEDLTIAPVNGSGLPSTPLRVDAVLPEGAHTYVYLHLGGPYKPLIVRADHAALAKNVRGERRPVALVRGTVYSPDSGHLIGEFGRQKADG